MQITIYHNPQCSNSRGALAILQGAGHAPCVVEYLKTPPTREEIAGLVARMGVGVRDVVRTKEPLFAELGLDRPDTGDAALLDALAAHPVLLNRPIVVTPKGAKLCRPPELVQELL